MIKDTEVWKDVFVGPKWLWKRSWGCTACHINRQNQVASSFPYHPDFPIVVITTRSPSGLCKSKYHERFIFPTYKTVSTQGILNFSHWTGFLNPKTRWTHSQTCTRLGPLFVLCFGVGGCQNALKRLIVENTCKLLVLN